MAAAILYDRVTKHYRGARTYRSLRLDVGAAAKALAGRGRRPRRTVTGLDDVTLEIPEGQSLALIGPNGAGKTTALRIAARITYPTTGRVRVRGRVGALIEVGAGMHPDLTGRENVDLYGRILGLSGGDVARRFDDIVEFAGLEQSIDQPVKQYSSGMQLRLGFSVAVHLDPDVLLVDEALAVGDATFQFRCIERMSELVRDGRTLVFVSHDMGAVERLCERAVLFEHGRIARDGDAREVVHHYLSGVQRQYVEEQRHAGVAHGDRLSIVDVTLHDAAGGRLAEASAGEPLAARIHFVAHEPIEAPVFTLGLSDGRERCFAVASTSGDPQPRTLAGAGYVECRFDVLPLNPRTYEVWGGIHANGGVVEVVEWQRLRVFRVAGGDGAAADEAPINLPHSWSFGTNGKPS